MQIYKIMYPFGCGYRLNLIKISLFILCFFTLPSLWAQEKKVTISGNNVPLSEIFKQIESQTKYSFAFVNSNFDVTREVTISAQNTDLAVVLNRVLKGTGYSYSIRKNRIFLSPSKVKESTEKAVPIKRINEREVPSIQRIVEIETMDEPTIRESVFKEESKTVLSQPVLTDSLDIDKTVEIISGFADQKQIGSKTPKWAIKSNLLFDLTGSISLGTEIKTGERYSFDLSVSYNPWEFDVNKNMKHILIQPEIRYWLCEPFNGHFFGLHGLYAHYNLSGLPLSNYMKDHRLQGDVYGVGLSYGYQWSLSKRWSLEANFGVGYVHANYDAYACKSCKDYVGSENKNYFAPTKAAISLIYFIK